MQQKSKVELIFWDIILKEHKNAYSVYASPFSINSFQACNIEWKMTAHSPKNMKFTRSKTYLAEEKRE
jgi:hypothetical protein